jgi:hypothetical protein
VSSGERTFLKQSEIGRYYFNKNFVLFSITKHVAAVCPTITDDNPVCVFQHCLQARNQTGQVGYVPEKYLQLPSSNSLMSMLQSLAALDARSHSSSNSTEPELAESELHTPGTPIVNGDSSGGERQ